MITIGNKTSSKMHQKPRVYSLLWEIFLGDDPKTPLKWRCFVRREGARIALVTEPPVWHWRLYCTVRWSCIFGQGIV